MTEYEQELMEKMLRLVSKGRCDAFLEELSQRAWDRRKYLRDVEALENSVRLGIGDRVQLKSIKPKYLIGQRGEIVKVERRAGKAVFLVKLDAGPVGKYRSGNVLVVASCVDPIANRPMVVG